MADLSAAHRLERDMSDLRYPALYQIIAASALLNNNAESACILG